MCPQSALNIRRFATEVVPAVRALEVSTHFDGKATIPMDQDKVHEMSIGWDVPIEMDDGLVLRADVFRPADEGRYPVILTHGPYGKGVAFQQGYQAMWHSIETDYPEILAGSSNRYQNWETVDPEKWVPDGYVVVRVDSRGAGRSPGYLDIFSPRETQDFYQCIEWAGVQSWSNGKVGLLGISYYGANQWQVAALQPPHLAAICPWEGANDYYREFTHHGGILDIFVRQWYPIQVASVQHGVGDRSLRNPVTGESAAGPETLSEAELATAHANSWQDILDHPLADEYYQQRTADLSKITVPLLAAGNWAHHLHTRGTFEGYTRVSSEQKWLEIHGLQHYVEFYTDYGVALQKRFFGHFLKGADTGWDEQPSVLLHLRHVDGTFEQRAENEWPLARTQWTKFYLDQAGNGLSAEPASLMQQVDFAALGEGLTYTTAPLAAPLEITGPAAAKLFVASSTRDADIFLTLRVLDPHGVDVTFISALDPKGVVGGGWLRASHRKIDPQLSLPYRPWHPHDERQWLTPGEPVELDVEIWPSSVLIPAGYRLAVTIQGHDFELPGDGPWPTLYGVQMRGNGIFVHTEAKDRPEEVFGGTTALFSGGNQASYLLLPVIPQKRKES